MSNTCSQKRGIFGGEATGCVQVWLIGDQARAEEEAT